jgi:hypothetical protein
MKRSISSLILAAAISLDGLPALAAEPARVATGTRVHVEAPSVQDGSWTGVVVGMDEKVLVLRVENGANGPPLVQTIPISAIVRLDILGTGHDAASEASVVVSPSMRVRLEAPSFDPKPIVGTVVAVDDQTLTMRLDRSVGNQQALLYIPISEIARVGVSRRGRRSQAGKGALIGGVAGLALDVALFALISNGPGIRNAQQETTAERVAASPARGQVTAQGALILMVPVGIGALIGASLGSASNAERWEPAALPEKRVGFRITPTAGRGWKAAVSVAF